MLDETAAALISSVQELMAVAVAIEQQAARRYRELATRAVERDESSLAESFLELAVMAEEHAAATQANAGDSVRHDTVSIPAPIAADEEALRSELLTPYLVLSLAVRAKQRNFAFYAYVAAYARDRDVRELAESFARAELEYAATLRRARRSAWRAEGEGSSRLPSTLAELSAQAAIWEAQATGLSALSRVRALTRNAERYLAIADQATDERTLAEAHRLAEATLCNLTLASQKVSP